MIKKKIFEYFNMNNKENIEKENLENLESTENVDNSNLQEETPANSQEEQSNEVEELDEVAKLKAELEESNNKFLRLYAEFDNYKRRTSKERIDYMQSAGKEVILSLLPILDDFERGLEAMNSASDVLSVKEGVDLIYQKLLSTLNQKGLKPMEVVGEVFDADFHEAIANIPVQDENQKGKIIEELQKGYLLNDKILRFAKVVTGQ